MNYENKKNILSKEGYLLKKKNYSESEIEKIKNELTVTPQLTFNLKKKPDAFPVYIENDKYLCIPKYYGLNNFGKPWKNKEIIGTSIDIIFNGILREDQKDVMNVVLPKLENEDGGLLCLRPGFGKTTLALYIVSIFKVKTLVIVHKSFLLNQWKLRIQQFTNAKVGFIQQDKIDVDGKDIVIGMLQSIAKDKYNSDIFRDFGLIIFDESHHAPSKYFSRALPIIASKKTLALTATPNRADKLEKVMYWYFGPILYTILSEKNNILLVNIYKYNTDHKNFKEYKLQDGTINRAKTINKLVKIDERNIFIIKQMKELLIENGRKILVLSDRIEHLKILKELVDKMEITTTSFYIGSLKQKVLDDAENAQVIFGSYSMASEGLDIPDLNCLLMATPRKEITQIIGRILRKQHEIQPIVIDIVDQLSSFARQSLYRKKIYKQNEYTTKIYEVEKDKIINIVDNVINIIDNNNIINNNDEFIDE